MNIIGKGGLASEVASYIRDYQMQPIFYFEFDEIKEIYGSNNIIAIGSPIVKENIDISHKLDYAKLIFAKIYGTNNIGEGTIICPGSQLTTHITIGRHVLINLNCTVGHNSMIGDYTTVNPGVNISGNVTIGKRCLIGTGAAIREKITICDDVIIGAGSVLVKDITEAGTYVGVPAKKIK